MKRIFSFVVILALWSIHSYADIGVSPIIVDLSDKNTEAEIAVKNYDLNNNAYVEITPYYLINPGSHDPLKKRAHQPSKDGLIVFPAKLVLLPAQTQFVRIIKTAKSVPVDKIFEVDFIPKISTHFLSQHNNGVNLGIRIIVGYGVRVTLRADHPKPLLTIKRNTKDLIIRNSGNTTVTINSCTQQKANKKSEIPLAAYTVYAGQIVKTQLHQATNVNLQASFMGKPLRPLYTN